MKPLTAEDFAFDGPLGSAGARMEELAPDHFHIRLGAAPNQPRWANKLYFQIKRNAKGHAPRIDVSFHDNTQFAFNETSQTWSYEGEDWHGVDWVDPDQPGRKGCSLLFPEFEEDRVWVGAQVPMTYPQVQGLMHKWEAHPHACVHRLGTSLGGLPLLRLTVEDPEGPRAPGLRWVHRVANEHAGEHNAQWRIAGMIEWLLSDAGAACRRRSIVHFIVMMCPDAPAKGWYRVNGEGIDMNRAYRVAGADRSRQAHESYVVQRDFERLMASDHPVTTTWSMHTWPGQVEPIVAPGPELGTAVGPLAVWRDNLQRLDSKQLIKPLAKRPAPGSEESWSYGPYVQFGITTVLCEGAGDWTSKQANLDAGAVLMQGLAAHYAWIKS